MSWKKYFKPVNSVLPTQTRSSSSSSYASADKYSSWLPEVYQGPPDRLQRYTIYETMDFDHEIHQSLDTLSDFSTEEDKQTKNPFIFVFNEEPSPTETKLLQRTLKQWCILNDFKKRMWKIFRQTLMYGDQFFVRDPETYKLYWLDPNKVMKILVNESDGKKIEAYYVRDLDLNMQDMVATSSTGKGSDNFGSTSLVFSPPLNGNVNYSTNYYGASGGGNGQFDNQDETPLDADHVVHISLSDGMNASWPFGLSVLETVYKTYKQKELLEDSILIYRVHRAPERRVFFIDVGTMPPNKAQQYLERIRYEVQQKRIPSRTGGGSNITDSTYNPMSMLEDYFFAVTSEGRGSKVETLPGGDNLGDIDDLRYFNNKMMRALGVPSSYLPTGPEDGTATMKDGRVGTAFIQEFRFSKVCERYQKQIAKMLDKEFKMFLKYKGITIDNSVFELKLTEPQSFSEYRQLELDAAQINVFSSMAENPLMSKRFAMKRYLGLTEEEIIENERMWKEEQGTALPPKEGEGGSALSDAGITSSGIEGMAPAEGFEEDDVGEVGDDNFANSEAEVDAFGEE